MNGRPGLRYFVIAMAFGVNLAGAQQHIVDVRQGTDIAIAVSPDHDELVIDLLGQLWRLPATGGGAVQTRYQAPNGDYATCSPDDIVYCLRWCQAVSGRVTTAGINTTLAFNDMDSVLAAYPNATISYPNLLSTPLMTHPWESI